MRPPPLARPRRVIRQLCTVKLSDITVSENWTEFRETTSLPPPPPPNPHRHAGEAKRGMSPKLPKQKVEDMTKRDKFMAVIQSDSNPELQMFVSKDIYLRFPMKDSETLITLQFLLPKKILTWRYDQKSTHSTNVTASNRASCF